MKGNAIDASRDRRNGNLVAVLRPNEAGKNFFAASRRDVGPQ
jgi:hypothetical protein